jgi:hypothetical protein
MLPVVLSPGPVLVLSPALVVLSPALVVLSPALVLVELPVSPVTPSAVLAPVASESVESVEDEGVGLEVALVTVNEPVHPFVSSSPIRRPSTQPASRSSGADRARDVRNGACRRFARIMTRGSEEIGNGCMPALSRRTLAALRKMSARICAAGSVMAVV